MSRTMDHHQPAAKRRKLSKEARGSSEHEGAVEPDPFDDDDGFMCQVADQLESSSQDFEDDEEEEELMCQVADELETSQVEGDDDDGVHASNRFVTRIGRPHPLLLPEVLAKVFSYDNSGGTLKTAREVCGAWYDAATPPARSSTCFRNILHVIEPYPYGLGYDTTLKQFTTPYPTPDIVNLRVADPCVNFTRPQATKFLMYEGYKLKCFSFDANLWCEEHMQLIRKVVFNWCPNLEELQLVGVSNRSALELYSFMMLLPGRRPLKLKKLIIRVRSGTNEHHHYSSTRTIQPQPYLALAHMIFRNMDGGVLGRIIANSENLEQLIIHTDFRSPARCLRRLTRFRVRTNTISVLELTGSVLATPDVTDIINAGMILRSLKLGPVSPRLDTAVLETLFQLQAATLEVLHLDGKVVDRLPRDKVVVLALFIPHLPKLTELSVSNVLRFRVGALKDLLIRLPSLKTLHASNDVLRSDTTLEFTTGCLDYLRFFFADHEPLDWTHPLENIILTGHYPYDIESIGLLPTWFPRLKTVRIVVTRDVDTVTAFHHLSQLQSLEKLHIQFSGTSVRCVEESWPEAISGLSGKRLKELEVTYKGLGGAAAPLRHNAVAQGFASLSAYQLSFTNFKMFDEDAEAIAVSLAESSNYTNFTRCWIEPKRKFRPGGVLCLTRTPVDQVVLTKVNLGMLIQSHFHAI